MYVHMDMYIHVCLYVCPCLLWLVGLKALRRCPGSKGCLSTYPFYGNAARLTPGDIEHHASLHPSLTHIAGVGFGTTSVSCRWLARGWSIWCVGVSPCLHRFQPPWRCGQHVTRQRSSQRCRWFVLGRFWRLPGIHLDITQRYSHVHRLSSVAGRSGVGDVLESNLSRTPFI